MPAAVLCMSEGVRRELVGRAWYHIDWGSHYSSIISSYAEAVRVWGRPCGWVRAWGRGEGGERGWGPGRHAKCRYACQGLGHVASSYHFNALQLDAPTQTADLAQQAFAETWHACSWPLTNALDEASCPLMVPNARNLLSYGTCLCVAHGSVICNARTSRTRLQQQHGGG